MELHELHVGNGAFGTVNHRDAVASGDDRIGSGLIDRPYSTSTHHGDLSQIGVHLLRLRVQHVCTIALDVGRSSRHLHAEVVLGNDLDGKMVFTDVDVGMVFDGFHESTLNLSTGVIGMVEDTELRMAAFAVEVELTVALFVEIDSPVDQFGDLLRCHTHHLFYGSAVGNVVTRYHRVFDVLVEIVNFQVGHTGNTALRKGGVRLIEGCLANEANLTFMGTCHLQSVTHTGDASTDDEEVVLVGHRGCIFSLLRYFGMTGCCYFGMAVYRYDVWEWKASSRERELEIETKVVGGRGITVGSEERFIHLHVVEETHGDKPTQRVVC